MHEDMKTQAEAEKFIEDNKNKVNNVEYNDLKNHVNEKWNPKIPPLPNNKYQTIKEEVEKMINADFFDIGEMKIIDYIKDNENNLTSTQLKELITLLQTQRHIDQNTIEQMFNLPPKTPAPVLRQQLTFKTPALFVPNPPSSPKQTVTDREAQVQAVSDVLDKYNKMKGHGIPEGAVVNAMIRDRIAPEVIKELFPIVELPSGYTGGGAVVNIATAKLQNVAGAATSSVNKVADAAKPLVNEHGAELFKTDGTSRDPIIAEMDTRLAMKAKEVGNMSGVKEDFLPFSLQISNDKEATRIKNLKLEDERNQNKTTTQSLVTLAMQTRRLIIHEESDDEATWDSDDDNNTKLKIKNLPDPINDTHINAAINHVFDLMSTVQKKDRPLFLAYLNPGRHSGKFTTQIDDKNMYIPLIMEFILYLKRKNVEIPDYFQQILSNNIMNRIDSVFEIKNLKNYEELYINGLCTTVKYYMLLHDNNVADVDLKLKEYADKLAQLMEKYKRMINNDIPDVGQTMANDGFVQTRIDYLLEQLRAEKEDTLKITKELLTSGRPYEEIMKHMTDEKFTRENAEELINKYSREIAIERVDLKDFMDFLYKQKPTDNEIKDKLVEKGLPGDLVDDKLNELKALYDKNMKSYIDKVKSKQLKKYKVIDQMKTDGFKEGQNRDTLYAYLVDEYVPKQ